jgi:hypothetical protein
MWPLKTSCKGWGILIKGKSHTKSGILKKQPLKLSHHRTGEALKGLQEVEVPRIYRQSAN